jgi:hypothetical protein
MGGVGSADEGMASSERQRAEMSLEKEGGVDGWRTGEAIMELGSFFIFTVADLEKGGGGPTMCCDFDLFVWRQMPSPDAFSGVKVEGSVERFRKNSSISIEVEDVAVGG